jgi:uroporphyrinogen decarboxylase
MPYRWYDGPFFKSVETIKNVWDEFGRPSSFINEELIFDSQLWKQYSEALESYLVPMPRLAIAMHEALFEGCGPGALARFIRKTPWIVHEMMAEYTKINLFNVKLLLEAGVEIIFYYDDLGQRDRSILSLEQFREYILPYYKQIYNAVHKGGGFIIQHSCGFVDELLPDMADAGLNCIQALEPAAGVNLAALKEKLGDRLSFMGGMDSSRVLNFGTPNEIEADVKKCIKAAGFGGGYFAGPSHNILDVPWENLLALRDAIEKWRYYPLTV